MGLKMHNKSIIFSGIQPSGSLHIGHYIGAIQNWLPMQNEYDCIFSLVDLHAITVRQNPEKFRENIYQLLALYLACGLDPKKSIIFCQSHVAEHAELAWILNCFTYMGELNRMTQFKDKSKKYAENINVGLFAYPVLMAADILLYQTNIVPVGADQKQHVELVRDIATRFNNLHGNIFTIPEPKIMSFGARIMGLQDPEKKMSKSDVNPNNVINLLDDTDTIMDKMKRAVTDSGKEVYFDEKKPGIANLLTIFSAVSGKTIPELEKIYRDAGYGKFKSNLGEVLIEFLKPIQNKYHKLIKDKAELDKILKDGAMRAKSRASKTLQNVNDALGFII